jgi:hypothetical protein
MQKPARILCMLVSLLYVSSLLGQDPYFHQKEFVSVKYLDIVGEKSNKLRNKLEQKSHKAIHQLQKQENKIIKRLMKKDSLAARKISTDADQKYKSFIANVNSKVSHLYISKIDTLATSLEFLQENPQFLSDLKTTNEKLENSLNKVKDLKEKFNSAEEIQKFIKERKQYLNEQLNKLDFAKELKQINKQLFYYNQQIKEYKELLKDSKKAEKKALELLSKTKAFKDFMHKHSQFASLFRMPVESDNGVENMEGLQSRAMVNGLLQQLQASAGSGGRDQFWQQIQSAQGQLHDLKSQVLKYGQSSSDDIIPDGFKPNTNKTKTFLQRLEYGTSIQSQKANGIFPTTTDVALMIGYRLNDKSIVGVGSSFKIGWGSGWRNLKLSSEGISLRSFIDYKIKGSFWLSGGYELNYKVQIEQLTQFNLSAWQQRGLLGISKIVSLKTKFFKKTKVQLLWDMLSHQQIPRAQPLIFRIGYNF